MSRLTAALLTMLFVAGCSDSVTLVTASEIDAFKPGSTNQTEVIATLGKPYHTITEADGTKVDQYPYAGGATGGGIMPSFLGGSSASSYRMVSFVYGAGGVLKSVDGK